MARGAVPTARDGTGGQARHGCVVLWNSAAMDGTRHGSGDSLRRQMRERAQRSDLGWTSPSCAQRRMGVIIIISRGSTRNAFDVPVVVVRPRAFCPPTIIIWGRLDGETTAQHMFLPWHLRIVGLAGARSQKMMRPPSSSLLDDGQTRAQQMFLPWIQFIVTSPGGEDLDLSVG